jgi:hypothetical protein
LGHLDSRRAARKALVVLRYGLTPGLAFWLKYPTASSQKTVPILRTFLIVFTLFGCCAAWPAVAVAEAPPSPGTTPGTPGTTSLTPRPCDPSLPCNFIPWTISPIAEHAK